MEKVPKKKSKVIKRLKKPTKKPKSQKQVKENENILSLSNVLGFEMEGIVTLACPSPEFDSINKLFESNKDTPGILAELGYPGLFMISSVDIGMGPMNGQLVTAEIKFKALQRR